METRKQQFKSAVSDAIVHLQGSEEALAPFGWTGEKAGWIAFVCLHSGAFTRVQCARFLDAHPEQVRRVVHALIAQGLAAEDTVPGIRGIGRVCRIFSRRIYRAIGAEHIRHRRDASPAVLMRRLLSLDYVIEHPGLPWLATESEKVAAFEALGMERGLLPVRVYRGAASATRRYFPVKLPVALDAESAVFVYADPGHATATALGRRGRSVEVVAVGAQEYGGLGRGLPQRIWQAEAVGDEFGHDHTPTPSGSGRRGAVRESGAAVVREADEGAGRSASGAVSARTGRGRLRAGDAGTAGRGGTAVEVFDSETAGGMDGGVRGMEPASPGGP